MDNITVTPRPEINDDITNLPTEELRQDALALIVQLETRPFLGNPLEKHVMTGDLGDCRKIYFGNDEYRLVYRILPYENAPADIDVIVIGARKGYAVYEEAVERLGRRRRIPRKR
jgi:hypothetical protein